MFVCVKEDYVCESKRFGDRRKLVIIHAVMMLMVREGGRQRKWKPQVEDEPIKMTGRENMPKNQPINETAGWSKNESRPTKTKANDDDDDQKVLNKNEESQSV